MITMELLGKIRRMHVRDKMSVRAIAKRTGLSRNTLQKWLQTPEDVKVPKYVRAKGFGKLNAFTEELEQALKADASRHKKDRRSARALLLQIGASGYVGSYSRVTDFIRAWRESEGKNVKAFVPLKFDLGEAFQFDWSEEGMVVGGIYQNGLFLNSLPFTTKAGKSSLADAPHWDAKMIEARTELLVNMVANANMLPGEKPVGKRHA